MKKRSRHSSKKKNSRYPKLSLFQKPEFKFFKPCPLSGKEAPSVDYKNLKLFF